MTKKIRTTNQFEKDLKKMKERGKDLKKIVFVMKVLERNDQLESRYRNHKLTGNYKDYWECHIEPDWLLIYKKSFESITLITTGTHSDLFKK